MASVAAGKLLHGNATWCVHDGPNMTDPSQFKRFKANTHSRCPQCANKNWVSDGNLRWKFQTPEKCRTKDCNHMRCQDCYDCDENEFRLQHCDGAVILNLFNEADASKILEWIPPPGDTRPICPCPLKEAKCCDKVFLTAEYAARHARTHNPIIPIPCSFLGCDRQFTRNDDKDWHSKTHH